MYWHHLFWPRAHRVCPSVNTTKTNEAINMSSPYCFMIYMWGLLSCNTHTLEVRGSRAAKVNTAESRVRELTWRRASPTAELEMCQVRRWPHHNWTSASFIHLSPYACRRVRYGEIYNRPLPLPSERRPPSAFTPRIHPNKTRLLLSLALPALKAAAFTPTTSATPATLRVGWRLVFLLCCSLPVR